MPFLNDSPTFVAGEDCEVSFLRRDDNSGAHVQLWEITAREVTFVFQMMILRHKPHTQWVFGSFRRDGRQVWKFADDARKKAGFYGSSYTVVHEGVTYAVFTRQGQLFHAVPFVDFLHDPDGVKEVDIRLKAAIATANDLSLTYAGREELHAAMSEEIAEEMPVRAGGLRPVPVAELVQTTTTDRPERSARRPAPRRVRREESTPHDTGEDHPLADLPFMQVR